MPNPSLARLDPARSRRRASGGFTIVEMLVVIAVIAALLGMLLAGLQAAQRSSKRTKQLNDLHQVFMGWSQYSNTYGDALMPGFIDEGVQTSWRVTYKYKDGTKIDPQYAQTYPWRLLPYLDHSFDTLYAYLEKDTDDELKPKNPDGSINTSGLATVASQPAFGYNAYYLGGWWTTVSGSPSLSFGNSTWTDSNGNSMKGLVVATKLGGVAKPDSMIAFTAAAFRDPGFYKMESDDWTGGSAWVVPHILADQTIWMPSDGSSFGAMQSNGTLASASGVLGAPFASHDLYQLSPSLSPTLAQQAMLTAGNSGIEVFVQQGIPQRRYGPGVPVVNVDGSTISLGLGELIDQRRWINAASKGQGMPDTFNHSPN